MSIASRVAWAWLGAGAGCGQPGAGRADAGADAAVEGEAEAESESEAEAEGADGYGTWLPVSGVGAPVVRYLHSIVWGENRVIVWGGFFYLPWTDNGPSGDGGMYVPGEDLWEPVALDSAPAERMEHSTVWTGSEMIVWGGWTPEWGATGARYEPLGDLWTPVATNPVALPREEHSAVWTGSEMIVVAGGGSSEDEGYVWPGARYDPAADQWTVMAAYYPEELRTWHTAVWTGSEMILWGGQRADLAGLLDTGARYDPVADAWAPTSTDGAPQARIWHTAVWTGSEMIIWGGSLLDTGGRYDPVTDSWTPTSTDGAPYPRALHGAVWTGSEMIVWGGEFSESGLACPELPMYGGGCFPRRGGLYDPVTDTWRAMTVEGAPLGRREPGAVWTGSEMVVWGGWSYFEPSEKADPDLLATYGGRYRLP